MSGGSGGRIRQARELARLKAQNTRLLEAIGVACGIIELGDQRLLAADGPAGMQAPELTLKEWRVLYSTLDIARRLSK